MFDVALLALGRNLQQTKPAPFPHQNKGKRMAVTEVKLLGHHFHYFRRVAKQLGHYYHSLYGASTFIELLLIKKFLAVPFTSL